MAASSGITVGAELAHSFATACSEANTRVFKVELRGETLVCSSNLPAKSSDADDFALLQSVLVEKQACYICYRMDTPPPCCWIFVMYVTIFSQCILVTSCSGTFPTALLFVIACSTLPRVRCVVCVSTNPFRHQILTIFQATKSALGGSAIFSHEMHCGTKDEATYAAYSADIKASAAPAPKTEGEVLKEQLKMLEIAESSGAAGGSGSAGANVAFPLSSQAKAAIAKIQDGSGQWITAFNVQTHFPVLAAISKHSLALPGFWSSNRRRPSSSSHTVSSFRSRVFCRCISTGAETLTISLYDVFLHFLTLFFSLLLLQRPHSLS
jgi:hypothetical protein